jgi:hypothetical protein
VVEAERALAEIASVARARGARPNLRFKDPLLADVHRAVALLRRARTPLERIARGGARSDVERARRLLRRALALLPPTGGASLGALLDDCASTRVSLAALQALLLDAAQEGGAEAPRLEAFGLLERGEALPRVRMERTAWETVWRNLFANALEAGRDTRTGRAPRLGVLADESRDAITGQRLLRLVLLDDGPRALTAEMIRGRAADRGLGVVADLVRVHEGSIDVSAAPSPGFTKGVVLDLPALEEEA